MAADGVLIIEPDYTAKRMNHMNTGAMWGWIGGIVGGSIGLVGGLVGTYYSIKNTKGPRGHYLR